MKSSRITDEKGRSFTQNAGLDDIIDLFEKYGINNGDNDELIKELAIKELEYGRDCLATAELHRLCRDKADEDQYKEIDAQISKKIEQYGGTPREKSFC